MLEILRALVEPPLVYAVAAAWVLLCAALLVLARFLNRRYVVVRRSEGTDQIAFELARIAISLEVLASAPLRRSKFRLPEAEPLPAAKKRVASDDRGGAGLSMFGR